MTFFLKKDIQHAFNQAADTYDKTAVLCHEVYKRMIARLDIMRLAPEMILDLGAGTGYGTQLLQKRYPGARVISMDLSEAMLKKHIDHDKVSTTMSVCGNAEQLPLQTNSVDFIFSNLMLPWCNDTEIAFQEIRRVLKPEGLFLFSTFGPDTLKEIRFSWARVDDHPHVHLFYDLHDIGDALLKVGFADPVMDAEFLTLTYKTARQSLKELRACGMHNILSERKKTVTGKKLFEKFMTEYETFRQPDGLLPNTYEITYGHAWKVEKQEKNSANEVIIPVSAIKRN
jgi:malonyl-CoA O-methyltransferase